jgi:RND family efflux transporter MFP subunit
MASVLVCLLAACRKGSDAAPSDAPAVVGARTAVAQIRPFTRTIDAIGAVAPRPGRFASLSAPAATRIAKVFVTNGQSVAAAEPLVQFEQASFEAAAQSAESALSTAEHTFERSQRLVAAGIIPRKDLDLATSELAQARANAVTARRARELSTLRSPLAGVVTRMAAVLGASVDANQPLVDVTDPSALDILLNVSPSEAAGVRRGAAVTLFAGQSQQGESLGTGTVADVAATVDSTNRTVGVRVHGTGVRRPLRIGETVFGQIGLSTHGNAVTVPVEALVPEGDAFKVFVVDKAGIAHARPVTVGGRTTSLAEITSGLNAGETIVTYGAYGVEDSAKVIVVKP